MWCLVLMGCGSKKEKSKDNDIDTRQETVDDTAKKDVENSTDTEETAQDDSDEKDDSSNTVLEKPTVSQDTWESTDSTNKGDGTTTQPSDSNVDNKQDTDNTGNVNDNTNDEPSDSEETTEPSLSVDGDGYLPLLP